MVSLVPTSVDAVASGDTVWDRYDGDELVCFEDRGVLIPHLLLSAVPVLLDVLDGGCDGLVKSLDLLLHLVSLDGYPQGGDRSGLMHDRLADGDAGADPEPAEGSAH